MQGRGACRTGLETTDLYKKEKIIIYARGG